MKPFTMTKRLGGRTYRYATYEDTKSEANKRAAAYRKSGVRARVTKEKSPLGKVHYAIWLGGTKVKRQP